MKFLKTSLKFSYNDVSAFCVVRTSPYRQSLQITDSSLKVVMFNTVSPFPYFSTRIFQISKFPLNNSRQGGHSNSK